MFKIGKVDIDVLGAVLDSTWGRASTAAGSAASSVKFRFRDSESIEVRYTAVVNLATAREMHDLRKRYCDEADSAIDAALRAAKSKYREACGRSLKLDRNSCDDTFEVIDQNIYNGRKTAYHKRICIYKFN